MFTKVFSFIFASLVLVLAACSPSNKPMVIVETTTPKPTSTPIVIYSFLTEPPMQTPVSPLNCTSLNYKGFHGTIPEGVLSTTDGNERQPVSYIILPNRTALTVKVGPNGIVAIGILKDKETKVYEIRNTSLEAISVDASKMLEMLSSEDLGIHRIMNWSRGGQRNLGLDNISIIMVAEPCNGNIVDSGFYLTEIQKQEEMPDLVHAGTYGFDGKTMIFLEDK